jgi:hypothetical protein
LRPEVHNQTGNFRNNQVKVKICAVFKFVHHPILPVNKLYDIAEKRPKMSPMMECLLVLGNNMNKTPY